MEHAERLVKLIDWIESIRRMDDLISHASQLLQWSHDGAITRAFGHLAGM